MPTEVAIAPVQSTAMSASPMQSVTAEITYSGLALMHLANVSGAPGGPLDRTRCIATRTALNGKPANQASTLWMVLAQRIESA